MLDLIREYQWLLATVLLIAGVLVLISTHRRLTDWARRQGEDW
jgi:hypothetical protein